MSMEQKASVVEFESSGAPVADAPAGDVGRECRVNGGLVFGLLSEDAEGDPVPAGTATAVIWLLMAATGWVQLATVELEHGKPQELGPLPGEEGNRLYIQVTAASHAGRIWNQGF